MSTATQVPVNGTGMMPKGIKAIKLPKRARALKLAKSVKPILVTYQDKPAGAAADDDMYTATVFPARVEKGTTIFFHTKAPGKVRIVFLSPHGNKTDHVADSQPYKLKIGGFYHFYCYFTSHKGAKESEPVGGTLDVIPHKP